MAYHSQTNGQIEQINQEVKKFLRHYVKYQQDDWTEWLAVVEFQYNDKRHIVIGRTLFELKFGQHLWKRNLTVKMELPKLEDFLEGLQRSWNKVKNTNRYSKRSYKEAIQQERKNS